MIHGRVAPYPTDTPLVGTYVVDLPSVLRFPVRSSGHARSALGSGLWASGLVMFASVRKEACSDGNGMDPPVRSRPGARPLVNLYFVCAVVISSIRQINRG